MHAMCRKGYAIEVRDKIYTNKTCESHKKFIHLHFFHKSLTHPWGVECTENNFIKKWSKNLLLFLNPSNHHKKAKKHINLSVKLYFLLPCLCWSIKRSFMLSWNFISCSKSWKSSRKKLVWCVGSEGSNFLLTSTVFPINLSRIYVVKWYDVASYPTPCYKSSFFYQYS